MRKPNCFSHGPKATGLSSRSLLVARVQCHVHLNNPRAVASSPAAIGGLGCIAVADMDYPCACMSGAAYLAFTIFSSQSRPISISVAVKAQPRSQGMRWPGAGRASEIVMEMQKMPVRIAQGELPQPPGLI